MVMISHILPCPQQNQQIRGGDLFGCPNFSSSCIWFWIGFHPWNLDPPPHRKFPFWVSTCLLHPLTLHTPHSGILVPNGIINIFSQYKLIQPWLQNRDNINIRNECKWKLLAANIAKRTPVLDIKENTYKSSKLLLHRKIPQWPQLWGTTVRHL